MKLRTYLRPAALLLALPLLSPASARAATTPLLGTAGTFAVLAGSTVTNTGPTTVSGDLGVSPGTAVTGFPPGLVSGVIHAGDAVATQAQTDVTTAYNNAAGQPCNVTLTGQDLGGQTLTPGVYCFASSAQLTGQLTLDDQGNPSSVFIFQIGSTLTTASNASVVVINTTGAQPCGSPIFWQVGSSATLGTNTRFTGNILALASIALQTGTVTNGGLYARTGAVTLDTNTVVRNNQGCGTAPTSTPTSTGTAPPTVAPIDTPTSTPTPPSAPPIDTATNTPTNTPLSAAPPINTATSMPTSTPASTAPALPTAPATGNATSTAANTPAGTATRTATGSATSTATTPTTVTRTTTSTVTVRNVPQIRYHDVTRVHTKITTLVRYHDVTRVHTKITTLVRYHDVTRVHTKITTLVHYRTVKRFTTSTRIKRLTTIRIVVNHKVVYTSKVRYVTVVRHITQVIIHHKTVVTTNVTYHYYHLPKTGRFAGPLATRHGAIPPVEARMSITRLGISWAPVWARDYRMNPDGSLNYDLVPAYGVTRFASSAALGQAGLTLMSGHDDIAGNIFRYLGQLRRGDVIQAWRGAHTFRYVVTSVSVVTPENVSMLNAPRARPTLALISCTPYWVDTHRVVVIAVMR